MDIDIAQKIISPYIIVFEGSKSNCISKDLVSKLGLNEIDIKDFINKNSSDFLSVLDGGLGKVSLPTKDGNLLAFQSITTEFNETKLVVLSDTGGFNEFASDIGVDMLSSIVEGSSNGCVIMDKGTIIYTNPRFNKIVGYNPDEILGKPFLMFVATGSRADFISACTVDAKGGDDRPFSWDVILSTKSGRRIYVNMFGGWYKGHLLWAVITDITDRKKLQGSLRNVEDKFSELFDRSPAGILYLTPRGYIRDCNRFVCNLIGYNKEEIKGALFTKFISSSEEAPLRDDFGRLYTESTEIRGKQCELITNQGKHIIIEYNAQIITRKGHKIGALMMFTDITEKKALENELLAKNAEMEKTLWEMTEMKDALEARAEELTSATEQLRELNKKLSLLSITDGLTELYNHRYFQERLDEEVSRVQRYKEDCVSLLMLDIDDFKKVNDCWGHQNGDMVLKRLARILVDNVRNIDIVARYGGEEFAIILPKTDIEDAYLVGRRICEEIASTSFIIKDTDTAVNLTVSIGVATLKDDKNDKADLIKMADDALYKAKAKGKNCIEIWRRD
ncbi:MAG: sensor domain-containing diguanylate cyclase [Deltaproteobacteria bacterium]|nr:sensor domain-containing diguanylate cyclase [Deltaproteobacteria bacterium]